MAHKIKMKNKANKTKKKNKQNYLMVQLQANKYFRIWVK